MMNLKKTNFGREGTVVCKLRGSEIDLLIADDEVTEEYAEKCVEAVNHMSDERNPKDAAKIGYQFECGCDWEIEHGMEIDILAYKRKDITIPIALHYAYNFLGVII